MSQANGQPCSAPSQPAHGRRLWHNRNFVWLWIAYGISAMGDHISEMALLKAQDALHSPNLLQLQAMISFMFFIPFFLLGPFCGMLADRLPRRGLMIFADLARAALMFNFALLIHHFTGASLWVAFAPLLFVGTFAALFSPARQALMPSLISEGELVRANAMISGLGVIASMLAVVIGGELAKRYPPQYAFNIDACTFIASAFAIWMIRPPRSARQQHVADVTPRALLEAVQYVREHARVAQLISIAVIVWICGSVVRSTIPTLVRDVYFPGQTGDDLYASMGLFQARLGLGMLSGAILLTLLGDSLRSEIAITYSLLGIAAAVGVLTFSAVAPVPTGLAYHSGGLAIILAGFFAAGVITSYSALMQRILPNRIRGRVFGLTDLATIAGLLLATGLLGIPRWSHIDRWVGWLLLGVTLTAAVAGIASMRIRLGNGKYPPHKVFWWNMVDFYCRWWFHLRREGLCTVPSEGPVILVINHTCAVDPLLLIAASRRRLLAFMIAEEYYRVPLFGRLVRMVECIPVRRDGQDVAGTKAALRHLKAGKPLGIFIEGRIGKPGEQIGPKDGAAMLALHTRAKVIPAHISGTRYDDSVWKSFFRRHRAVVRFGQPIDLSRYWDHGSDRNTISEVSKLFQESIRRLGEQ